MRPTDSGTAAAPRTTRRHVVKTGVRLAYAAPLVAATLELTTDGVLGGDACVCPANTARVKYFRDTVGPHVGTCAACRPTATGYDQTQQKCIGGGAASTPLSYVAKICGALSPPASRGR
jgi:hypothetical protein